MSRCSPSSRDKTSGWVRRVMSRPNSYRTRGALPGKGQPSPPPLLLSSKNQVWFISACERPQTNCVRKGKYHVRCLLQSGKLARGGAVFNVFFHCSSNLVGNLGHLKPCCILTHLIGTGPHNMSIILLPNFQMVKPRPREAQQLGQSDRVLPPMG